MARSQAIWLVTMRDKSFVAAFTVKHEMIKWLQGEPDGNRLRVFRMPDNPRRYDPERSEVHEVTQEIRIKWLADSYADIMKGHQ